MKKRTTPTSTSDAVETKQRREGFVPLASSPRAHVDDHDAKFNARMKARASSFACKWCKTMFAAKDYCGRKCRQAAWRLKRSRQRVAKAREPMRFKYFDPPYPGHADLYPERREVDHPKLIADALAEVRAGQLHGFALSTSAAALRELLPLFPAWPETRWCPWVKPGGVSGKTAGLHNAYEMLIVYGGRKLAPGVRDFLIAKPMRATRDEAELIGQKPLKFCGFLFDALGMVPGDTFVDVFPGTGIVTRAWELLSPSVVAGSDRRQLLLTEAAKIDAPASAIPGGDASLLQPSDALLPFKDDWYGHEALAEERERRGGAR